MNKLLACTVVLAASCAPALADTLSISYQGVADGAPVLSTTATTDYATGVLSYTTAAGGSFLAYCVEPEQPNALVGKAKTYTLGSFTGRQASLLQGLYSSSFASAADLNAQAAFQLAVWEIVRETSATLSLTPQSGSFFLQPGDAASRDLTATVESLANGYLAAAQGYDGPALYTLTQLSNATYQDLVFATPVPEPHTLALLLAGLSAVGLLSWRRSR